MAPTYDIVVSTENSHYQAWQAMLFHYSCAKYAGRTPIIVVHGEQDTLVDGFRRIERKGDRVQRARNYRDAGGLDYSPRNAAGSLACVQSDADYLVVCDPDMIVRPLPMESHCFSEHQVSFDQVSYLFVNDKNVSLLKDVCDRAGLSVETLRQSPISGGVPHIVPAALRETLSQHWLLSMEFFALDAPPSLEGGLQPLVGVDLVVGSGGADART